MYINQNFKNLIGNIINLIANIAIGLYYTPFLVHELGIIAYGVVPLSLIINQYIGVVTGSLTSSFSRFYTVALQQKRLDDASSTLSTSFLVILCIISLLFPILECFVARLDTFFNIPSFIVVSSKWLFRFTIFSFYIALFSSIFNTTLYALNRLDLFNAIKALRTVLKLIFVVLFFEFFNIDIFYVGLSNFVTEILLFILSLFLFLRYKPKRVNVTFRKFNWLIISPILSMTLWTIIHQIGDTALYRIDNIVVNRFMGIEYSSILGAISEFGVYVIQMTSVLSGLFGPLIIIAYSKKNHKDVQKYALGQSFVVGMLSAIFSGVLAGASFPLLKNWLGDDFVNFRIWLIFKLILVPFYASGGVLSFVLRAWNRVKFPALMTTLIGGINLVVILTIANLWPYYETIIYLIVINVLFSISQCYILTTYCVGNIYPNIRMKLYLASFRFVLVFVFSFMIAYIGQLFVQIENKLILLLTLGVFSLISFGILYLLGVFKEYKRQLLLMFK